MTPYKIVPATATEEQKRRAREEHPDFYDPHERVYKTMLSASPAFTPTEGMVEGMAAHLALTFWKRQYGDEVGTATRVAHETTEQFKPQARAAWAYVLGVIAGEGEK